MDYGPTLDLLLESSRTTLDRPGGSKRWTTTSHVRPRKVFVGLDDGPRVESISLISFRYNCVGRDVGPGIRVVWKVPYDSFRL